MYKTKLSRFVSMILALVMALSINVFAIAGNTITFIVTGDSIHQEGNHTAYEEWINTSYELKGENVGEIMQNVLADKGYSCDYSIGQWGGYLNSISTPSGDTLGAGTNGAKSGWMSSVNDVMPSVSMDQVYPAAGDVVKVFYIDDYEAEIYGYYSTINVTPDTAELKVYDSAGGTVEPSYGSYSFFNGTYTYNASAEGYMPENGDFTVSGAGVNIDIVLKKADVTTETTSETTTEAQNDNVEWGLFRNNSANNGIIIANTPDSSNAFVKWSSKVKSGWDAFCGMAVANDCIYTAAGSTVYKLDKNSGEIVAKADLDSGIAYTYFISYADNKLFVQLGKGQIEAFDGNLNKLWTSEMPNGETGGQGLTPVYYNDGKVYAGTVCTGKKGKGYYYCLDADNGSYIWTVEGEQGQYNGFYWSGCVAAGDYIVTGGEGGKLYVIDGTGNVVDSAKANGDIRSTVVYDNGNLYFTDKTGYIYSVEFKDGKLGALKSVLINPDATASTSTPAVYEGKIYVGAGGKGCGFFSVLDTDLNMVYTSKVSGNVQSSPLVAANEGGVKAYFTCNSADGSLMVYDGECRDLIDISEYKNYCIHSPVADSLGTIYYQNDSGSIVAIGKNNSVETTTEISTEISTEATTEISTEISTEATTSNGGSVDDEDIKVSFSLIGDSLWINENNISMERGSFASDLIKKVFENNNVSCIGLEDNYIKTVTYKGLSLSEFDKGPKSGWMYRVNGNYPSVAINNYALAEGDRVEFVYVEDYTKLDYDNPSWSSGGGGGGSSKSVTISTTAATTTAETTTELTTEAAADEIPETDNAVFNDVNKGHWAYTAVDNLYSKGIIKGKTENSFAPDDNVTRAEFVTMLYRLAGAEDSYSCNFNDVSKNNWYYDSVSWAYENGIVFGVSAESFEPSANITRQDMACIAERFADKFNVKHEKDAEFTDFADSKSISAYAKESVENLCRAGIVKGNDRGEFMPLHYTTRAEAVVILNNLII